MYIAYYIMLWAFDPKCSHIAVLAGDGDFYPVLRFVHQHPDKQLMVVHFEEGLSDSLMPYGHQLVLDRMPDVLKSVRMY